MKDSRLVLWIIFGSFCLATFLGYIDYETESLYHLFTAEPGNIIALIFYTGAFTIISLAAIFIWRLLNVTFLKK